MNIMLSNKLLTALSCSLTAQWCPHVCHTVAARVDDHVRLKASDAIGHGFSQMEGIHELVVRGVPLADKSTWVIAARVTIVLTTEAVIISITSLPQVLVASNI